ncbi:MAG: hypothetical protein V7708_12365 [Oceanicoccus sp.]
MRIVFLVLLCIVSSPAFSATLEQLQQQGHIAISYKLSPSDQAIQYQPVTIEIEIATNRWFSRGTRVENLDIEGAVVNRMGSLSTNSSRQLAGVTWAVQLWTLVIYPQKPGVLSIPAIDLFVSVNTENDPQVEGIISVNKKTLEVIVPESMAAIDQWWATTALTVEQSFQGLKDSYQPGDAITHTIAMSIEDVPAMMLPQLMPASIDGLAVYSPLAVIKDYNNRGILKGTRQQQFIYTVERSGNFSLPAYQFYWWNLVDMKKESIILESQTLIVDGHDIATISGGRSLLDTFASIPFSFLFGCISLLIVIWGGLLWLPKKRLHDYVVQRQAKKQAEQNFLDAIRASNGQLALQALYDLLEQRSSQWLGTLDKTFGDDKACADLIVQLKRFAYDSGHALSVAEAKQLLVFINREQARVWPWQKQVKLSLNR